MSAETFNSHEPEVVTTAGRPLALHPVRLGVPMFTLIPPVAGGGVTRRRWDGSGSRRAGAGKRDRASLDTEIAARGSHGLTRWSDDGGSRSGADCDRESRLLRQL